MCARVGGRRLPSRRPVSYLPLVHGSLTSRCGLSLQTSGHLLFPSCCISAGDVSSSTVPSRSSSLTLTGEGTLATPHLLPIGSLLGTLP